MKSTYDEVDWTRRRPHYGWKTGKAIYGVWVAAPAHWDDNAVKITADKIPFDGLNPAYLEYEWIWELCGRLENR